MGVVRQVFLRTFLLIDEDLTMVDIVLPIKANIFTHSFLSRVFMFDDEKTLLFTAKSILEMTPKRLDEIADHTTIFAKLNNYFEEYFTYEKIVVLQDLYESQTLDTASLREAFIEKLYLILIHSIVPKNEFKKQYDSFFSSDIKVDIELDEEDRTIRREIYTLRLNLVEKRILLAKKREERSAGIFTQLEDEILNLQIQLDIQELKLMNFDDL